MTNPIKYKQNKLQEIDLDRSLNLFHILRNKTRFKILLLLTEQERNVTETREEIQQSQSAISHQLSLLKEVNIVRSRRIGRKQYYSINDSHVEQIIDLSINHVIENC